MHQTNHSIVCYKTTLTMPSPNIATAKRSRATYGHDNQSSFLRQRVIVACCLALILYWGSWPDSPSSPRNNIQRIGGSTPDIVSARGGFKVLYIVTTLSEYDTGARSTKKGWDRLQGVLIPVVSEGVRSMLSGGFSVDVVLICHFTMQPERLELVRNALPSQVGLQVWDNASPLGYKLEDKKANYTQDITRALARQHRYVIKDKLSEYDLFACFEDDMLIKAEAIQNYVEMTQELYRLREFAPDVLPPEQDKNDAYYGVMTKAMLKRTLPGFIRVEVLLDEANYGTQEELDPVPVTDRPEIDPKPCCHVSHVATSENRPESPKSDDMFLWETNILALGVRKMPLQSTLFNSHNKYTNSNNNNEKVADGNSGWVLLQRGPLVKEKELRIPDYWSGQDGYFGDGVTRPHPKSFPHINNQGGWMATRQQIWEWHTEVCAGSFLPPYEAPNFKLDGLDTRNVEYWSGGLHMFTREYGCMLQRIVSLDPERFSRQLLYHTANNKQRQLTNKRQIFTKVNDLVGQLNTVRANAEAEMHKRLTALAASIHQ